LDTPRSVSNAVDSIVAVEPSVKDRVPLFATRPVAPLAVWNGPDIQSSSFGQREPAANPPVFRGTAKVPRSSRTGKGRGRARVRPRILVVDDVADVTEMIGLFLKHAGYEVATAGSARAALQLARDEKFDIVISDIGMPQMNGYELAGELRTMPDYKKIPIVAVTGYSEYDDRGRAVRAGFSTHLTKPIDPTRLLNLIGELLG
jgi:CheY-like chemotaxis protein